MKDLLSQLLKALPKNKGTATLLILVLCLVFYLWVRVDALEEDRRIQNGTLQKIEKSLVRISTNLRWVVKHLGGPLPDLPE